MKAITNIKGEFLGHPVNLTFSIDAEAEGKAIATAIKAMTVGIIEAYIEAAPSTMDKIAAAAPTLTQAANKFLDTMAKAIDKVFK